MSGKPDLALTLRGVREALGASHSASLYARQIQTHFAQWRELQHGRLVSTSASDDLRLVPADALISAVLVEVQHADALVLLPPEMRQARLDNVAMSIGTDAAELLEIMRWWRECGCKVPGLPE